MEKDMEKWNGNCYTYIYIYMCVYIGVYKDYLSHSLDSLKGVYIGDYIGLI